MVGAAIDGRLSWLEVVRASSVRPAQILGCWPRKGALAVGADADVVLIDPVGTTDLGATHMTTDFAPFAGLQASGKIAFVYRRGELVIAEGELRAERGSGSWIPIGPGTGRREAPAGRA
jgi:dihydropyrimidinase